MVKRLGHILAERSTMSLKQIERKWHRTDWWLDAREALELKFIDEIV
jgi:ATP-dependent protease ClpP protease subunit